MAAADLFEAELRARSIDFRVDNSGRFELLDRSLVVSLDNLSRELTGDDRDGERVSEFVDLVLLASERSILTPNQLVPCLEPNDYTDRPPFASPVSPRLDRVLTAVLQDGALLSWVNEADLTSLDLAEARAWEVAASNLDAELRQARVETDEIDRVTVAWFETPFPSKASFILAPALREVVGEAVGWPVLAVVPDRDFLYLWGSAHRDFIPRLGQVVLKNFSTAPHPLTTEVFEIDSTVVAIGAYAPEPERT